MHLVALERMTSVEKRCGIEELVVRRIDSRCDWAQADLEVVRSARLAPCDGSLVQIISAVQLKSAVEWVQMVRSGGAGGE